MRGFHFFEGSQDFTSAFPQLYLSGFQSLLKYQGEYDFYNRNPDGMPSFTLKLWLGSIIEDAEKDHRGKPRTSIEYLKLQFNGVDFLVFNPMGRIPMKLHDLAVKDITSSQPQSVAYQFESDSTVCPDEEYARQLLLDCHSLSVEEYGNVSVFQTYLPIWQREESDEH